MSLVGSLEDLGLGDILQIISLSQKSGVLLLRSEQGEGRIVFRDGLVRAAHLKDGVQTLRALLVGGGFVSVEDCDRAAARAEADGLRVEDVLAESGCITAERIDALQRENVESVVIRMFGWRSGDFSFEVRDDVEAEQSELFLPAGINAQYLAMEGTRLRDEDAAEPVGEPVFSGEDATPAFAPPPPVAEPAADAAEAPFDAPVEATTELEDEESAAPAPEAGERGSARPAAPASALGPTPRVPLVVIEPDLRALEWVKECLAELFPRIHIFQSAEHGLARVRQYLSRGGRPIVLVAPGVPGDRLSGIDDAPALVRRIKAHAPRLPVLWLAEGEPPRAPHAPADGCVVRPAGFELADPRAAARIERAAQALRSELGRALDRTREVAGPPSRLTAQMLSQLREVTDALADASNRGVVLPLVIDFATRSFARVAMFMLREGEAFGMAQAGLSRAGGPDDKGLAEIRVEARSIPWFANVIERRKPLRAAPSGDGDRRLAELLGDEVPLEAYVAPLQTGGEVVALLYADNLPGNDPMGDTSALEVVLHHAGLALDRAVLERALAEAEGRPGAPGARA